MHTIIKETEIDYYKVANKMSNLVYKSTQVQCRHSAWKFNCIFVGTGRYALTVLNSIWASTKRDTSGIRPDCAFVGRKRRKLFAIVM